MWIAYAADGSIVATLDFLVQHDPNTGRSVGRVDWDLMEAQGMKLRQIADVPSAVGSGTWPEFLGPAAHDFRVELEGKKIVRLVHHRSKHVRHRAQVEAALLKRRSVQQPKVREGMEVTLEVPAPDVSDIIGKPTEPLELDQNGRTRPKRKLEWTPLPVHSARQIDRGGDDGDEDADG